MKFHLDTSTVIDIMRFHRESLLNFELTPIQDIAISSIVAHELFQGSRLAGSTSRSRRTLNALLATVEVVPFRIQDAEESAEITNYLSQKGRTIGLLDPFIAAHAISENAVLVTRNLKHFSRVPELRVADWSKHADS